MSPVLGLSPSRPPASLPWQEWEAWEHSAPGSPGLCHRQGLASLSSCGFGSSSARSLCSWQDRSRPGSLPLPLPCTQVTHSPKLTGGPNQGKSRPSAGSLWPFWKRRLRLEEREATAGRDSWGQNSRAQVSSAKERVPGKSFFLKWSGVGWGEDSLLLPTVGCESSSAGIPSPTPRSDIKYTIKTAWGMVGGRGGSGGAGGSPGPFPAIAYFLSPTTSPAHRHVPKQGLRQGAEKVTLPQ